MELKPTLWGRLDETEVNSNSIYRFSVFSSDFLRPLADTRNSILYLVSKLKLPEYKNKLKLLAAFFLRNRR